MLDITELFVFVDDVCKEYEDVWLQEHIAIACDTGHLTRKRKNKMKLSGICTILIEFHRSSVRSFKQFYIRFVQPYWKSYFPETLSYTRFIALAKKATLPLLYCLELLRGTCTGLSFVESSLRKALCTRITPDHKA